MTDFPIIFDGYQFAQNKAKLLKKQVQALAQKEQTITVAAIVFKEDEGSLLYTNLKADMAAYLNIGYQRHYFSLKEDEVSDVTNLIDTLNHDPQVTGIIIQKPWRKTWLAHDSADGDIEFKDWWQQLTTSLDIKKDVDGLHPQTLATIQESGKLKPGLILPATAQAVLDIMSYGQKQINQQLTKGEDQWHLKDKKIVMVGRSALVGKPVYHVIKQRGYDIEMIGRQGLEQRIEQQKWLREFDVIISATGRNKLITSDMITDRSMMIDVGEPRPDIDFEKVKDKCLFITPVPGGVGPVTVISLMENAVRLEESSKLLNY